MTNISQEEKDAMDSNIMKRLLDNPDGVPTYEFDAREQKYLVSNEANHLPVERTYNRFGWIFRRTDIMKNIVIDDELGDERDFIRLGKEDDVLPQIYEQEETKHNPQVIEQPRPTGVYSFDEVLMLKAQLESGQELTTDQQRTLLATTLQTIDTLMLVKSGKVQPLDKFREEHGTDFIYRKYALLKDFDKDHLRGEVFTIYRVTEGGRILAFWGENDKDRFELRKQWVESIKRID